MTVKSKKPSKFTPERRKQIIQHLELGATPSIAAKAAAIHYQTLYLWIKKGKNNHSPLYKQFYKDCEQAKAKGAAAMLSVIRTAAMAGDWKPAAWFLERYWKYSKEGIEHEYPEDQNQQQQQQKDKDPKELIWEQLQDLKKGMKEAQTSGSWQAFAALQRAYMSTWKEYNELRKETEFEDNIDKTPDEDLIVQITEIICNLPPILQNQIMNQVLNNNNNNIIPLKNDI